MKARTHPSLLVIAVLLTGGALAQPAIVPAPRLGVWLPGSGSTTPLTVETVGHLSSPHTKALLASFRGRLPGGQLPAEGYLLAVGDPGSVAVVADARGAIRLDQTLRQLPAGPGACPRLEIADWPDMAWRGIHVLDSGPGALPQIKRLIHEVLAREKCNVLVYEIDYNFKFASHPEIPGEGAWTRTEVGDLVAAANAEGIEVIPQINCLGHQSWKEPPSELLKAHPEIEEIPDGKYPQTDLAGKDFYCRSWCPSNPATNKIIFALIDELIDAFHCTKFHCGMDEVFLIGSDKCPLCKGKNPAALFAKQVNDLHAHLKARHVQMLMWGDRFLDGKVTGYGDWDASTNGTAPAIDRVPKDIILCDWHYEYRDAYPSLKIFPAHGFRMWPTVYSSQRGALKFMNDSRAVEPAKMLGVLTSIWIPVAQMEETLLGDGVDHSGEGAQRISRTAVAGLDAAWAGPASRELAIGPNQAAYTGVLDVTIASATAFGAVHYTVDGTAPTPASPAYAGPIRLETSATITAAVCRGDAVSMRTASRFYERLELQPPVAAPGAKPGLTCACYLSATSARFERVADFANLKPNLTGTTTGLDVEVSPRETEYGLAFTGWLNAPADGLYTFTLSSDDGSVLWLGDRLVVDNDGFHNSENPKSGQIALKAGKHPLKVLYFQGAEDRNLDLAWEGPGVPKGPVPPSAFSRP